MTPCATCKLLLCDCPDHLWNTRPPTSTDDRAGVRNAKAASDVNAVAIAGSYDSREASEQRTFSQGMAA